MPYQCQVVPKKSTSCLDKARGAQVVPINRSVSLELEISHIGVGSLKKKRTLDNDLVNEAFLGRCPVMNLRPSEMSMF